MNGVHMGRAARVLAAAALWAAGVIGAAPAARAGSYPAIATPVADLGGYLTAAEREAISAKLVAYREATGIQLAVLLVPSTRGEPIEDYGQAVFDAWGGGSKGRDDGALFILAVDDHRSRLQLGYGLESYLGDGEALLMLDSLRPALRDARYASATHQLIDALWAATADVTPGASIAPGIPRRPWFLALVVLLAGAWGFSWRLRRPRPKSKSGARRERKKSKKQGPPGQLSAAAWLARHRRYEAVALFLAAPTLLALATRAAMSLLIAYPVVWFVFAFIGWWWALAWTTVKIGRWFLYGLDLAVVIAAFWLLSDDGLVRAEDCLGLGVVAFVVCGFFTLFHLPASRGGSSTYGRSTWSSSSSSSSSSGSSWSSSSSSSSSSSYSSSSWSGGGGSSGGGGASSSW